MNYEPSNHRRSRLDPISCGATRPLYRDDEDGDLRAGFIITALVVLLAIAGLIMWFGSTEPQIADDPPAAQMTTGQGGQPASSPGPKK
jgi:hypothetical protein